MTNGATTNRSRQEADRPAGFYAGEPQQIPIEGWRSILGRTWRRIGDDHLDLVAAGMAFYGLLALFPALAVMVALYGLIADPSQVGEQFATLKPLLPSEAYGLMYNQMQGLAQSRQTVLGTGLIFGILLSAWSAAKGTKSLIAGLNLVYNEHERRGFFRLNLIAYGMTLGLLLVAVVVIALVVAVPVVLGFVGLGDLAEILIRVLRWPLLGVVVLLALAVVYRYGPSRRRARWRWVSWGSLVAVVLWLTASALFSAYVASFGNYNATYGSVGAVIVLLMWLFISGFAIILGALLNAEMERQTGRDSTRGPERPRGLRGAYVADHLPE